MRSITLVGGCAALMVALLGPVAGAQTITQIIDQTGDGTYDLVLPRGIALEDAVEGRGNVYVVGTFSDNAFKITPGGAITRIIDASGDGLRDLDRPTAIAVDASGNVYVAGAESDNVFKITPGGTITQIIDAAGDGTNRLNDPRGIAADASGNVYVTGQVSDNAFEITPGGLITRLIGQQGDGTHGLDGARGIFAAASGNVYVTGADSDNAFMITSDGAITEIIDSTGDGTRTLDGPRGIAVDASGSVFVSGTFSDNVFEITPDGTISEILGAAGDGTYALDDPRDIAVSGSGVVYVVGERSDNAFEITPDGMALASVAGLVVPGFEVEIDDQEGPTTLFAVRNTSGEEVACRADFFGVASIEPLRMDAFSLGPQATLTHNVRTDLSQLEVVDGVATGFIIIAEIGGTEASNLEGDYFRLDGGNDFATGDRLVRSTDFCLRQEVRFVDFGSGSSLRILLNRPRGAGMPSFSYTAYDEAGGLVANGNVATSAYLSVLDIAELVSGGSFGTVLFDFSGSGGGWVSAKYSAFDRFSVELNAACRD